MSWAEWVREVEVEPSLYAADASRLGSQVRSLLNAGARVFHFDVGDGHFVEPVTMGPVVLRSIAPLVHDRGGVLDCHLMVENPARHIPQIAEAGGDSVTFHLEASGDPNALISVAHEHGLRAGVAFNPGTPVAAAAEAAAQADLALCMSIEPGYSGQKFLPESLARIQELRGLLPDRVFVQVDGGLDHTNAKAVYQAGAQLLVAGTAIFGREDLPRAYRRLTRQVS